MFEFIQSHRLDDLAAALRTRLSEPLESVLAQDTVVVPSKGLGRWLTFNQADADGICANVDFLLPASFIWRLIRRLDPSLPLQSDYDPEVLRFRVLALLDDGEWLVGQPRLATYLAEGDERRRFELAGRIADLFDQYQVYRDDWLAAWARGERLGLGEDERWQAAIWQRLAETSRQPDRGRLVRELVQRLESGPVAGLPPRLFLFGISSLQLSYLEVFIALGRHLEVVVFGFSPCIEYWADIRSRLEQARLAQRDPDGAAALYVEEGHPLLASWGGQGRDFFTLMMERLPDAVEPPFLEHDGGDSLLACLQRDILTLSPPPPGQLRLVAPDDRSLAVHVCHSRMRELEVLHDELLRRFADDPGLMPGDVVVLVPNIEDYAPYIRAVFGRAEDGVPSIPYALADREPGAEDPLWPVLETLLGLSESRFELGELVALLEHPAVAGRFALAGEDVDALKAWLSEAGVRWGRDGAHRASLGLPASEEHTWRWGLARLALGFALPEAAGGELPLFEGRWSPQEAVEGSGLRVLAALTGFAETLFAWAERLARPRPPRDWQADLLALYDDIVGADDEDELRAKLVKALALFAESAAQAGYGAALALPVVRRWLLTTLGSEKGASGFLTGAVTFGTLIPMRSIPFRVVCALGLDFDSFPRKQRPADYDLMARAPRLGDRSRRADDRYLMLETLFAARDALILSYVGRDIRSGSELPSSVVIAELLECLESGYVLPNLRLRDALVHHHPLHPFAADYYRPEAVLRSFNPLWCQAAAAMGQGAEAPGLLETDERLPVSDDPDDERWIAFDELLAFYQHPARYLARRRLGLRLEMADAELAGEEPFSLEFFEREQVRQNALTLALRHRADAALALSRARGLLPPGPVGDALARRACAEGESFAERVRNIAGETVLPPRAFVLTLGDRVLSGALTGLRESGLVIASATEFRPRLLLQLWLRHLVLCALAPEGSAPQSRLLTLDGERVFGPVVDAQVHLDRLVTGYREGCERLLPLFPKTGYAYAEPRFLAERAGKRGPEERDKAWAKAVDKWTGSSYYGNVRRGESDDAYYALLYRHDPDPLNRARAALDDPEQLTEFESLAEALWFPVLACLEASNEER